MTLTIANRKALLSPFGSAYSDKVRATRPSNLIGYWPLSEQSGITATDLSGNGRSGTYSGVDLAQPGIGDGRTAPFYDGTNDYGLLSGPPLTSFASAFSASTGTLMLWFKMASASVWTDGSFRFMTIISVDSNNFVRIIKSSTNNNLQLLYDAGSTQKTFNVSYSSTDWTHAAITWDKPGDQVKAYVNGMQSGSTLTGLGAWAGTVANVYFGAQNSTPTLVHSGWLAHIAAWSAVLTATEIARLAVVR